MNWYEYERERVCFFGKFGELLSKFKATMAFNFVLNHIHLIWYNMVHWNAQKLYRSSRPTTLYSNTETNLNNGCCGYMGVGISVGIYVTYSEDREELHCITLFASRADCRGMEHEAPQLTVRQTALSPVQVFIQYTLRGKRSRSGLA